MWENVNTAFKARINQLEKRYSETTAFSGCRTQRGITDKPKTKHVRKYEYCKTSRCFVTGRVVCFTGDNAMLSGTGIGHHYHFTNGTREELRN